MRDQPIKTVQLAQLVHTRGVQSNTVGPWTELHDGQSIMEFDHIHVHWISPAASFLNSFQFRIGLNVLPEIARKPHCPFPRRSSGTSSLPLPELHRCNPPVVDDATGPPTGSDAQTHTTITAVEFTAMTDYGPLFEDSCYQFQKHMLMPTRGNFGINWLYLVSSITRPLSITCFYTAYIQDVYDTWNDRISQRIHKMMEIVETIVLMRENQIKSGKLKSPSILAFLFKNTAHKLKFCFNTCLFTFGIQLMVDGIADCKHGNENRRENGDEEGCGAATSALGPILDRSRKKTETGLVYYETGPKKDRSQKRPDRKKSGKDRLRPVSKKNELFRDWSKKDRTDPRPVLNNVITDMLRTPERLRPFQMPLPPTLYKSTTYNVETRQKSSAVIHCFILRSPIPLDTASDPRTLQTPRLQST
ncbi:hypothetical protein LXL04_000639 [Taraxacum kok-saghyz]